MSGASVAVSGLSTGNIISSGTTAYILVTASVSSTATAGGTIRLASTAFNNIVFLNGVKNGTDPLAGGVSPVNDQTITSAVIPPTKLVITNITPSTPFKDSTFTVVVQSQDGSGTARSVLSNTTITLLRNTGTGTLGGTLSGQLNANSNTITFNNVTYNVAETGVIMTATPSGGDALTAGNSISFTVLGVATHLVFVNVPATGHDSVAVNSFTVQALRADQHDRCELYRKHCTC